MITSINEFKNNFDAKLDKHVLGFLFKYGSDYITNKGSLIEYLQNNDESNYTDENVEKLKSALLDVQKVYENKDENLADDIEDKKDEDELKEIDPNEYEVDKIIDIFTDYEEVKETVGSGLSMDLQPKTIERGQTIYLTAMLKPRNKSTAYKMGEMGVIKVKVQQTWYGLNKLNRLKKKGLLYN